MRPVHFYPPTVRLVHALGGTLILALPQLALAQANPFQAGAEQLVVNFTDIATPFAIIAVMVLAVVAMTGRISWGWPIGVIVGIGAIFAAPQIVTWVEQMFA